MAKRGNAGQNAWPKELLFVVALFIAAALLGGCEGILQVARPAEVVIVEPALATLTAQAELPTETPQPTATPTPTPEPTETPTETPARTPTKVPIPYPTPMAGSPTVRPSWTIDPTPSITKVEGGGPIIVQVNVGLFTHYGVNLADWIEEVMSLVEEYRYEFVTLEDFSKTKKPIVLVFEGLFLYGYVFDETFIESAETLKSFQIPAVVGFPVIQVGLAVEDIVYLKSLVNDEGWQIANNGYTYGNFLPYPDLDLELEIVEASKWMASIFEGNKPEVLVIPQGLGQDNPAVYQVAEFVDIKYVIGPRKCTICNHQQSVKYLQSIWLHEQPRSIEILEDAMKKN